MKKLLIGLLITALSSLTFVAVNPANAAAGDSISLYFSAPFVQGSHLTGSSVYTETFNSIPAGACSTVNPFITFSGSGCSIDSKLTTNQIDGEPSIGGNFSSFAYGNQNSTFTFASPVKYVGFWWMMGNNGNEVRFYEPNNATPIATLNTTNIVTFLGISSPSNLLNSDTATVTRIDGGTHPRRHYFRSPQTYGGTLGNPTIDYSVNSHANEPWVYLNLYVGGATSISKVAMIGSNFEFDTLTASTAEAAPRGDMVLVSSLLGTTPSIQTIAWAPTNTTADISAGALTPDNSAVVTSPNSGGGAISYSVVSAGTSGCTVNSSTGVITATAAGTCVVKATAAAVNGTPSYYSSSTNSTFTFTANAPAPSPSPTPSPSQSQAPSNSTPYVPPVPAEITSVVLTKGNSSSKSNIKVKIKEPNSSSLTTDVKVRLVDFSGKVFKELTIPVANTTETVELAVDVPYGDFNVEAVALNRYMTSQSVYSSADLVRKNFFESRAANRAPTLVGSTIGKPVYFAANSAKLTAAAKKSLASLAEHLKKSDSRVALTGFASKWNKSTKFERSLATKRSYAVGAYLKSLGVTNWVYYAGYGALTSVDSLPSARKVELRVVD